MSLLARVVLVFLIFSPALPTAAGIPKLVNKGDLVFQAGRFTKAGGLGSLRAGDLRHASKAENISGLLDLAIREGRIDPIRAMQLRGPYQVMESGDLLLFTCLRHQACQPEQFRKILSVSHFHAEVVRRSPGLGPIQANQEVGALTERLMHRYFESSGWTRVQGEVGRQGIDGLYVQIRRGVVKDVLIAESKYNTSVMKSTGAGMQMSPDWVRRKVENLRARFPDEKFYTDIQRFVDNASYRALLWEAKIDEEVLQISLTKLIGKGGAVERSTASSIDGLRAVPVSRIQLDAPANDFEKRLLGWIVEELDSIGELPD